MNQKNIISKLTLEEKIAMIHAATACDDDYFAFNVK